MMRRQPDGLVTCDEHGGEMIEPEAAEHLRLEHADIWRIGRGSFMYRPNRRQLRRLRRRGRKRHGPG